MKPTQSMQVGKTTFPTLVVLSILLTAVLVSVHPISCSEFWWELSKGRAVAAGSMTPSHDLLAGPVQRDADWLSGLPFYLLFSKTGVSGLMGFKLIAAILAARLLTRHAVRKDSTAAVLIATSLISARQAWEPSPLCFDALGILAVLTLTKSMSRGAGTRSFIGLLIVMCCWSNFGARSVVGVLIVFVTIVIRAERPMTKALRIGVSGIAASLTPAGAMTLVDSWKTTFPLTTESQAVLRLAGWNPWWESLQQIECAAWLMLSVVFCWQGIRQRSTAWMWVLSGSQLLAALSSDNLPLAAMLVAFAGTQSGHATWDSSAGQFHVLNRVKKIVLIGSIAVVGTWTLQPWNGCGSGLGWGLDPRLSPDSFAASLNGVRLVETAHCVGVREAGLLTWHVTKGVKPFDTPHTALLNGRLRSHVLLTSDLSQNWQVAHRRADNSWGGWWLPLLERKTSTLVVPCEDLSLNHAMEPTIWKPLSLNSVSIVYGKAGDPCCTHQIVNTLSLREFVDRGAWVYETSSEEGSGHTDLLELITGENTDYESLRLARVFRSMNLSVAALKVLSMLPIESQPVFREEYAKNQLALGYEERIQCGRSSRFRLMAWRMNANASEPVDEVAGNVLKWPVGDNPSNEEFLIEAAQLYVRGDHRAAIQKLNKDNPESLYAKALVLLEYGRVKESEEALQQFVTEYSEHRLKASVQLLLASLVF